jgi:hypothetical protein
VSIMRECERGLEPQRHADQLPPLARQVRQGRGDPPPLKWSDLRYVFDIKEDCNGKEAIQA